MTHLLQPLLDRDPFAIDRFYNIAPFRAARSALSSLFNDSVFDYANRYELTEKENGDYELTLNLPGFKKDEVSVELERDVLTVSASNSRSQYSQGLTLWHGIDVERIETTLEHGVLTITLPRSESSKPRKLTVK